MGGLPILGQGCVRALRGPSIFVPSSIGPYHRSPCSLLLCERGFVVLEGIRHRLLGGHRSAFRPLRRQLVSVELRAPCRQVTLAQLAQGGKSQLKPDTPSATICCQCGKDWRGQRYARHVSV
jgi:hypothetical protein